MKKLIVAALAALAILTPTTADAARTKPETPTSYAKARTSCSGTLGDYSTFQHSNFGDLTDADGDPQADVVIVGDSITTRGWQELQTWLNARDKTLAGNYWSGRPATPAVDWALSLTTKPKILVFADLTNNIFDPGTVTAQLQRLKAWADAAPVTRLIVVDTFAQRTATATCDLLNAGWINNQARDVMAGGQVCSWWNGFADNPARVSYYIQDGIHPYEGIGTNYWAAVVGGCIY